METFQDIPVVTFPDSAAWEAWLACNYTQQIGVWLKISKKDSGIASVSYAEALDICLCYGWIDGQRRSYDERYYLQKYTPRRKRSLWSKVNISKVEALIAEDRMRAPGLQEIELAKADGRWDAAYESQSKAVAPPDLLMAFEQNFAAKAFYETLTKAEKYAVLWRLMTAKNPTMREARLAKMIQTLAAETKV